MAQVSNPRPAKADKTQRDRLIETACELGCDEDEAAFEEKLKRIASVEQPPKRLSDRKKP
jgi:hypothetical protein